MASVACSPWETLAPAAVWLNGAGAAVLRVMAWTAEAAAGLPGMRLEQSLPEPWLGPAGAALLAAVFLAQAQSRDVRRLLGAPAAALAGWLGLVIILRALS
jgi:hypothetical protein